MTSELTQSEADALLAMMKRPADDHQRQIPGLGGKLVTPLVSLDGREQFLFDINQSSIVLEKVTYQTRGRVTTILARLDLGGAPHRNPDDSEVGVPHLHLYREGFDDKWAFPVPSEAFSDISNKARTLEDFLAFCNVVERPNLAANLFA